MSIKIQLRRDSADNWSNNNSVLSQGEIGLETDSNRIKIGNGNAAWNDLNWFNGGTGIGGNITNTFIAGEDINSKTVSLHSDGKVYNYNNMFDTYIGVVDNNYNTGDIVNVYQMGYVSAFGFNKGDIIKVGHNDAGTITNLSNSNLEKNSCSATVYNNKIYVIGGYTSFDHEIDAVEIYDIATDTWTTGAHMPTKRRRLSVETVNGKIYAIGGRDGSNYLATVEIYDPDNDTWTTGTDMTTARRGLTTIVYDNKIYAIAGYNGNDLNKVEIYDPSNDTWTAGTNLPTNRSYGCVSAVINDKIYVIGGYNDGDRVDEYDIANDVWNQKSNMPTARTYSCIGNVNDKIYVLGGSNGTTANEVYDPAADVWTQLDNLDTGISYAGSTTNNNIIYLINGDYGSNTYTSQLTQYDVSAVNGINNRNVGYEIGKALSSDTIFLYKI